MKSSILISGALGICLLSVNGLAGLGKSRADMEREGVEAFKAAEAEAKIAEKAKIQAWMDRPREFFSKYMIGSYGMDKGKPVRIGERDCVIVQILTEHDFLGSRNKGEGLGDEIFHATGANLANRADGDGIAAALVSNGVYKYKGTDGAMRTVRSYRVIAFMTAEDYAKARATFRFQEEPQVPARAKLPLVE